MSNLPPEDFEFLRKLIYKGSAMVVEPAKAYLVESRLSGVAKKEGLQGLDELVARLRANPNNGLHGKVIDAMTINETSFFRDRHPFDAMQKSIIPEVMQANQTTKSLSIWSAAGSSGQEAYSILMMLSENFPELMSSWSLRFTVTDISPEMIEKAKDGKYSQIAVNRGLPARLLVKYFDKAGLEWRVKDRLRKRLEFKQINLAGNWPMLPKMDIIMLRNVLIYFDTDTKKQILAKMRGLLRPPGCLFLGGSETTLTLDAQYDPVKCEGTTYYRPKG